MLSRVLGGHCTCELDLCNQRMKDIKAYLYLDCTTHNDVENRAQTGSRSKIQGRGSPENRGVVDMSVSI